MTGLAELSRDDSYITGRMTRRFEPGPGVVWRTMTGRATLALWLAPGRIELKLGGAVRLEFEGSGSLIASEVLALEVGELLEFSWSQPGEPERPVRWDLSPDVGGGTRLTVTIKTPQAEDPGRACAGWNAHMAMLAAALAGAPIGFPFEVFKAAREAYKPVVESLA